MARPKKVGLDYFPLDVDIFNDEKVAAISGEFGIKGELLVIKLLCAIYRNGYFLSWNKLTKMKLAKDLLGVSPELVDDIVNRLVAYEFFNEDLFNSQGSILSSTGIQHRYFEATKRRVVEVGEYPHLIIDVSIYGINVDRNPITEEFMSAESKQIKLNKIKEDKIKNSVCVTHAAHTQDESKFFEWINKNTPSILDFPEPFTVQDEIELTAKYDTNTQIIPVLEQMHNNQASSTKRSARKTFDIYIKNLRGKKNNDPTKQYTYTQACDLGLDNFTLLPNKMWVKKNNN